MNKETLIIQSEDKEGLKKAAEILKKGGLVAIPTETVYGLGANALDEDAAKNIFKAKGRPQDNPLIVHISDIDQLKDLVSEIPEGAYVLMEKFWPGPLTLIMKKSDKISDVITAGLDTVAIRMPSHPVAREIIELANLPIAAPSANISGRPSPTDASHVIEDLVGRVDAIVDGGRTGVGVESTVVDISSGIPTILRPGGITEEDLLVVFPRVDIDPALKGEDENLTPKSPGQKYKHYSPNAKIKIIKGELFSMINRINHLYREYTNQGLKVGILATEQSRWSYSCDNLIVVGDRGRPETIATNLFDSLREFDKMKVDMILAEGIEEIGIGKAIMNRMEKAAGFDVENL
ncbi:threonylcarbamoyl-AMP synthase [Clostridium sp. D2Q-11]|uniref:Threonylcarbamoyl-AMP synthase n=1 Tax=Anaeromonas frigoriresistens TaxID=2683708 RepID=A0A942USI5_9FIRM|nr:L-threonylcarbamoyladenylate synthase [Anaeromonas frigoriresistens]MBS4538338.1 threonylcarbamoyl-AMP synthase [Anaeromonas frigoriresistens]